MFRRGVLDDVEIRQRGRGNAALAATGAARAFHISHIPIPRVGVSWLG
jgi:hypothetical protein